MTWQPAPLLYPDVELLLCDRVRAVLAEPGLYVGNAIPKQRKPRMVIFNRDGGPTANLRDRPRVRCRIWAASNKAANDLARALVASLPSLADGAPIVDLSIESGPYEVPDESGQPQRYLLLSMQVRSTS